MTLLDAIQNQSSSDTAVAVEALASGLTLFGFLAFQGKPLAHTPAKPGASSPTLLAVGGSNPDSGFTLRMFDGQTPLGGNGFDIFVVDDVLFDGVDNNNVGIGQGQLWSNPKSKDSKSGYNSKDHVEQGIAHTLVVENGLNQVKSIEQKSNRTPNQIGFGFENNVIIHNDILSGKTTAKKENA
jgi:hypothetical protein